MTLLSRRRINGVYDQEGHWTIMRIVNGQPQIEEYPDFHTARHRMSQIARDSRRRINQSRRGRKVQ